MEAIADRVRLPLAFDAPRMAAEVRALALPGFVEYSVVPLTAPAFLVDPSAPPPRPTTDYADGSWTAWADTPVLRACPYLGSVVDTFREHARVTLVRLLRLAPGGRVAEHTDPTLGLEVERSVVRLTIPIVTNPGARLILNDEPVPLEPGACWYLRFTDPHRVVNEGGEERIHLSIDLAPNAWLRSLLTGGVA